jgi:hypothetical protein
VSDSAIRLFDNRCRTYLPPEPAIGRPAPADASPSGGLVAGGVERHVAGVVGAGVVVNVEVVGDADVSMGKSFWGTIVSFFERLFK